LTCMARWSRSCSPECSSRVCPRYTDHADCEVLTMAGERADEALTAIRRAFQRHYQAAHPRAKIDLYRHSKEVVRVRIIDPEFTQMSFRDRRDHVESFLESVPSHFGSFTDHRNLLLLTPEEAASSFATVQSRPRLHQGS